MANYFWVGGTGTYDGVTNHFATTSGGVASVAAPTSADNVTFDTPSNATAYTVTFTATFTCLDLTIGPPLAGSVTWAGAGAMNVFGNIVIGSTTVQSYTGALSMKATSGTKTITPNGVSIAILVFNGVGGTFQLVGNLTITGNGSILILTNGIFDPNGNSILLNNATPIITGAFTFYNLTVTPATPAKTNTITFTANVTITNLFTVSNGATVTNRVLVQSSVVGTPRTITAAAISIANADFMDITGAGAATWDMSASTSIGDAGGNTMQALGTAAFTAAATQHWTNASSGSWSLNTNWTSRVPLPQDPVVMDKAFGTSQTVTADMPRLGASIDWTGATWTTGLTWAMSTATSINGSLTMIVGLTMSGTSTYTFTGRGAFTLDTKALSLARSITFNAPTGTLTLAGALTIGVTNTLALSNGTFSCSASNYLLSVGLFTAATASTFTPGTAQHLITGVGSALSFVSPTLTTAPTFKFTDATNSAITFAGGGRTFGNVWFSRGASTGSITISGSNTFADFKDDGSAAHSILFTAGTTQTTNTFTMPNSASAVVTLNSTTTGIHTLVKATAGKISCDWLNIQHSVATPGDNWYAGANSVSHQTDVTAGSGWIFTTVPAATVKTINGVTVANIKSIDGLAIGSVKT